MIVQRRSRAYSANHAISGRASRGSAPAQQDGSADQVGERKGDRVEDLEDGVTCARRRLHDAVGDAAREVVLEPADGLAQHLPMRAPADQGAQLRQDAVVQKRHVETLDQGPKQKDEGGGEDQLGAMGRQHLGRGARGQQVDDAAHVPDQPDLDRGDDDRHQAGDRVKPFERLGIGPQERPQPTRGGVGLGVGRVGIDQRFEKAEHRGPSGAVPDIGPCLEKDHDGGGREARGHDPREDFPRRGRGQQKRQERTGKGPEQADEKVEAGKGQRKALRLAPWAEPGRVARGRGQRYGPDLGVHPLEKDRFEKCEWARTGLGLALGRGLPERPGHPSDPGRRGEFQSGGKRRLRQQQRADAEAGQPRGDAHARGHAEDMGQGCAKARSARPRRSAG